MGDKFESSSPMKLTEQNVDLMEELLLKCRMPYQMHHLLVFQVRQLNY
ncbi:hypothetical protein SC09_Contig25orf00308 [Bacillus subtilis]|uniref:Uncharacterized protein n=1 Tax=Bacillus subtilis TaxID=1423 RepID=A0A0D1IMW3_BACIU|nr:hypothetical protein SC09_Contig25orf00308 [Bacillus subtilis]